MKKYAIVFISLALSSFCFAGKDLSSQINTQLHSQSTLDNSGFNYGGQDISRRSMARLNTAILPTNAVIAAA